MIDDATIGLARAVDMVRLAAETQPIRRRGAEWVCLCPFHQERTPSCAIIPRKNAFYCHGCEAGGGPIDWIMRLHECDFPEAVRILVEREGGRVVSGPGPSPAPRAPREAPVTPLRGRRSAEGVLPLDQERWGRLHAERLGAVEAFAEQRALAGLDLRALDVIDVGPRAVGFTYRDPETDAPCMVKVRKLAEKVMWVEPKPGDPGETRRALMPLYLATHLRPVVGEAAQVAFITEGEVDALTLHWAGIRNAVSLPQGAGSARHVDLTPLLPYPVWALSTDEDAHGFEAARILRERARSVGVEAIRVRWSMIQASELVTFKDANEMRMRGLAKPSDFHTSALVSLHDYLGFDPRIAA